MIREVHISQTVKRELGLRCPSCGGAADSGTTMSLQALDAPPQYTRGALAICMYCGAVNVYDKPLLRTLTRTERRAILRKLPPKNREEIELAMKVAAQVRASLRRSRN